MIDWCPPLYKMKAALYARVSREDLTNENQLNVLVPYAQKQGWEHEVFQEVMTTRKTRPVKAGLMQRLRAREFDILLFTRLDRFGRDMEELIIDVNDLIRRGVRVIALQQGMDLSLGHYGTTEKIQLAVFSVMAETERDYIRDRTNEGLARAKAQGKRLGRPRKSPPVNGGEVPGRPPGPAP